MDVAELPVNAQICNCNGVSKGKNAEAVEDGKVTLQEVCLATRAGTRWAIEGCFEEAKGQSLPLRRQGWGCGAGPVRGQEVG